MTPGSTAPGLDADFLGEGAIDPHDVPVIVEVFSNSERAWFAALVVVADGGALTVRFIDAQGGRREKSAYCEDPRVALFGTYLGSLLPPGVQAVPSSTRPGQFSYFDSTAQQKFATAELAWQAYLERHLLSDDADVDEPVYPAPESVPAQVLNGSVDEVPLSPGDCGNSVPTLPAHLHVVGTAPFGDTALHAETDDSQADLHIPQSWLPHAGSCPVSAPSGLVLDGCSTTIANAVQAAVRDAMRGDGGRDELGATIPEVDEHREFSVPMMVEGIPEDSTNEGGLDDVTPSFAMMAQAHPEAAAADLAAPPALGVQQVMLRPQSPRRQIAGATAGLPPIVEEHGRGLLINPQPGMCSAAAGMPCGVEDLQTSYVYRKTGEAVDRVARVSTASTTVESGLVEGPLVVAAPVPAAEVQVLNATPATMGSVPSYTPPPDKALTPQRPVALPATAPSAAHVAACSAIEVPRATPPKSAPSAAALNLSAVEGPSFAPGRPMPRAAPTTASLVPLQGRLVQPSGGASEVSHLAGIRPAPAAPSSAPVLQSAMVPSSAPVVQPVSGPWPQAPAQLGAARVAHSCGATSSTATVTPSMPGSGPIYEPRGGKVETVRTSVPFTELATPQRAGMVELPSFTAPKGPGSSQEAYLQACGVDAVPGAAQQPPAAALSPDLAQTYGWNELQTGLSQTQDYHTPVQHVMNQPWDPGAGVQHAGMAGGVARPQPQQRDPGAQSHGVQRSHQHHQHNQQQQEQQQHVTLPLETLQNLLSQQTLLSHQNISFSSTDTGALVALGQYQQSEGLGAIRKRSHENFTQEGHQQQQQQQAGDQRFGDVYSQIFSVPSPLALSPIYVEQKPSMNGSDDISTFSKISPRTTPRPSPASTPPPMQLDSQREREYKKRNDSGRCTPIGKRSRPQSPTSDCDSDGSYREREPLAWASTGRMTPTETKPAVRLEDMVDEDKYNKRKRSTSGGPPVDKEGRKKDPLKAMLEQLQSHIPHIGNPDEEKVSHAGLLVEGSDYIRSLMRENNTTGENVEALKMKIEQLNAEIEDFQQKLPEHGSSSIHRIVSSRGKSIPDMFADHVRQRTQSDWRYWVFTSIMGHFVHSFAQDVSNISPQEMQSSSIDWLGERMSLQQLRKDAFRKLAKLCSKTSIMEDPSKLPEEARSFVALNDPDPPESKAERESYGRKF